MNRAPNASPAPQRTLRLLSCNILAGASVQRYSDYFTRSVNAVLPGPSKLANLDSLAELLHEFDVVGLQEADAGSLRSGFLNQTRYIAEAAGMPFWSHQPNRPSPAPRLGRAHFSRPSIHIRPLSSVQLGLSVQPAAAEPPIALRYRL